MAWALVGLPLALLVFGFPIFLLLLATSTVVLFFFSTTPPVIIHQRMLSGIDTPVLLAVPFFIFAGEIMARGGISGRLIGWVNSITGGLRGNLPLTSLGTATIFGAISGSTAATVAAVGTLTYPSLRQAGYNERFASGMLTSAGAISNIIPPSIAMILYGFVAEVSVIRLFAAGILPGLLLSALFAVYILYYAYSRNIRDGKRFELQVFLRATTRSIPALGAPAIILGGIYGGFFSPTEAGGIACVYAVLVALLVHRDVGPREIFNAASDSMYLTAQIFIIVAAANIYSRLLIETGAAGQAVDFIASLDIPPWLVLLIINLFLLGVGTALDTASAILVLSPLLAQIAVALGVDPVHFGIIVVMNLTIGTFTPPFGLNIFVGQAIFDVPLSKLYPGLLPFILISIAALMIVTYVPALSLWILQFI
ncbi:MAG: TRAP transporter large permease [Alphaproteobacteria bacterium]